MPRKKNPQGVTKSIRIAGDLADMLSAIVELGKLDQTIGEFIDPLIRPVIESRYEAVKELDERIKKLKQGNED